MIPISVLRDVIAELPEGCVARGYEGEVQGIVFEMKPEKEAFAGQMIEVCFVHNSGKAEKSGEVT